MGKGSSNSKGDLHAQYAKLLKRKKENYITKASPVKNFTLTILSPELAAEIDWRQFSEGFMDDHKESYFWCDPLLEYIRKAKFHSEKRWIDQVFCYMFASHISGVADVDEEVKMIKSASIIGDKMCRDSIRKNRTEVDDICLKINEAIRDPTNPFNLIIEKFKSLFIEEYYKEIQNKSNELEIVTTNLSCFMQYLIYCIPIFYKSVISSTTLSQVRELLVNHMLDITVKDEVYKILHEIICKKVDDDIKTIKEKIKVNFKIIPKDLKINEFLSLTKEDKEIISAKFNKKEDGVLGYSNTKGYKRAIDCLKSIKTIKTPIKKMETIASLNTIICDCIDNFWSDVEIPEDNLRIDADQYLSILLYIIIQTDDSTIYADVVLADELGKIGFRAGYNKYCLTTLMGAYGYILSKEFPINSNELIASHNDLT